MATVTKMMIALVISFAMMMICVKVVIKVINIILQKMIKCEFYFISLYHSLVATATIIVIALVVAFVMMTIAYVVTLAMITHAAEEMIFYVKEENVDMHFMQNKFICITLEIKYLIFCI